MTYPTNHRFFLFSAVATLLILLTGCRNGKVSPDPQERNETTAFLSLLNFDGDTLPAGLTADGATARQVSSFHPGDDQALEITFPSEVHMPIVSYHPEQPWDWSGLEEFNIALDARNTGRESIQLYLGLTDATGAFANRSVVLAPGETRTCFIVLDGLFFDTDSGMRESPLPWETSDKMFVFRWGSKAIDLTRVTELSMFVRGTLLDKSIAVDNIRLRRNPAYGTTYLEEVVDEFGQNAKQEYPIKIDSEEELKKAAETELAALSTSGPMPDRSRFGGWKDGPRLAATGYFRTEKVDGKWWMVDPEGYIFFSHGLANVRMANLSTLTGIDFRDPTVREIDPEGVIPVDSVGGVAVSDEVRQTRYVASSMRRNMFTWLPEYDSDLADHYSYRHAVHQGPVKSGETYSFYRANLERRYGETAPDSYMRKWEEVTLARMQDWGFTSMGNWVDPAFYPNQQVPYFANGWIIGNFKTLSAGHDVWAPMPDPFDPEFAGRAELTIHVVADEIKGSPWCVGVFIDNEKSWGAREGTVEQRYGLILDALSRDTAVSPAKNAFTEYLRARYETIDKLNGRWKSGFGSWDTFAKGVKLKEYTPESEQDLSAMLAMLSEEYFRVVHDALARALPNHLYMGVRMASWGMPEETVRAAIKYSDVLSFNIYQDGIQSHGWSFLYDIDLPCIIGEFHIGATRETGLFHGGLVQADGQADRARMYKAYMESVLSHDMMVGAHWFQYVDSPITGRAFDGEPYNVGFVTVTDIPYPEMVTAAKAFNAALYPKRYNNTEEIK